MADLVGLAVEDLHGRAAAAEPGEAEGLVDLHDDVGALVRALVDEQHEVAVLLAAHALAAVALALVDVHHERPGHVGLH